MYHLFLVWIVVWVPTAIIVGSFGLMDKEKLPGDTEEAQSAMLLLIIVFAPLTFAWVVCLFLYDGVCHLGTGFADLWRQWFPRPELPEELPEARARKKTIDVG